MALALIFISRVILKNMGKPFQIAKESHCPFKCWQWKPCTLHSSLNVATHKILRENKRAVF